MTTDNLKSNGKPKPEEVEPFKNKKDIERIKQYLLGKGSKRDYMLFVVGINIGLRAGDLLSLKYSDILENGKIVDSITIIEEKTLHTRKIVQKRELEINDSAKKAIQLYLESINNEYDIDDYIFTSRKGNEAITVGSAHKIIKAIARDLKIKGNYGTHSLRKTFGYHAYNNGIPLETLQKVYGHSTQAMTLKYIGITKEVIKSVYHSLNL
ncbi:MAG: tyrosine-type recombinase/integrase [Ruminiclostridium sp.]